MSLSARSAPRRPNVDEDWLALIFIKDGLQYVFRSHFCQVEVMDIDHIKTFSGIRFSHVWKNQADQ